MILQCKAEGCDALFTGHVSRLDAIQMYGFKWTVTKKKTLCPQCTFNRKCDQQFERNRSKSIGTVRGETATFLQKKVRLYHAASEEPFKYAEDGKIKEGRTHYGWIQCVTCGKVKHYKDADGGHYHRRGNVGTLLLWGNIHPQCKGCNDHLDGNYAQYHIFMVAKYGKPELDLLAFKTKEDGSTFEECAVSQVILRYDIRCLEDKLREEGVS